MGLECLEDLSMSNRFEDREFGARDASFRLEDALFRSQYLIQIYALAQQLRPQVLMAAFGEKIDVESLQWLIEQFEGGDFSAFPTVETRPRSDLDGARSLYIPEENAIYLAEDFAISADRDELLGALLQEIVNAVRTTLDE